MKDEICEELSAVIIESLQEVQKPILMVDMDGVMADFNKAMSLLVPDLFLGEGDDYEARSKRVDETCLANPDVFLHLEPIPGAIEAINKLTEHYDVFFLSTPMSSLYESYAHKPEWLRNHFGDWVKKRLFLTHRKDLVYGDYLIDDRTRNGAGEFKGMHIHFGTDKFPDWDAVLKYLL